MRLVVIESPLAGDVSRNRAYAKLAVLDSLARGEAPYASHLFFAQEGIFDDADPEQRQLGMEAGFAWGIKADLCAVYADHGYSKGMIEGIHRAIDGGIPVVERFILTKKDAGV